jgi:hypothetical protein
MASPVLLLNLQLPLSTSVMVVMWTKMKKVRWCCMRWCDWLCILHSVTTFPDGGGGDDENLMPFMSKLQPISGILMATQLKMDVCVTCTPKDKIYIIIPVNDDEQRLNDNDIHREKRIWYTPV